MITDQLGLIFSAFFRPISQGTQENRTINDITGNPFEARTYGDTALNRQLTDPTAGASRNVKAQIGDSNAPPTRADFKIGSPFLVAPESGQVSGATGIYTSGIANVKSSFGIAPTGGTGTIKEVIHIVRFNLGGGLFDVCLARNLVPDSSFILGQSIAIEWEYQF